MPATKADVLKQAASQIGYAETPVNRTKYGKWYGLDGQPWCAMFVSWVASKCDALDIIPKHAYTPSGAAWFKKAGRWHTSKPKSGDVAYFQFPGGPDRIHHVGFVESVRADGSLVTIEGNTSPADNRNGGMVMRRVRNPKYVVGYGRPEYIVEEVPIVPETPKKLWIGVTFMGDAGKAQMKATAKSLNNPFSAHSVPYAARNDVEMWADFIQKAYNRPNVMEQVKRLLVT